MQGGVVISMIGCGRREGTRHCLERALATAPQAEFILTDNASKDGTGKMFEEVARARNSPDDLIIFHEPENTGFIPPGNRAYRIAAERGAEFLILLNDDTDPPPGWLEKLLAPFANKNVALTCPHGTCCTLDHAFNGHSGGAFEYCEGSCLAIRMSAIRSFSTTLFDENLTGIYGDDSNLSLRAREKGWDIARADFDMPHIRSATTRAPEVAAFCEHHREKNHTYNRHRFSHYLNTRRFDFPIVVKRSYAIGDVLLATPVIRAIAHSNPLSPIHVQTDFPELFARNPHVHRAAKSIPQMDGAMTIDLDGSYENMPMTHILEAYEATARRQLPGLENVEWKTELHPSKGDIEWADFIRLELSKGSPKFAIIGSDPTTWRGKNWPEERFTEIRARLHQKGWKTASVGTKKAEVKTTITQLAALLSISQLFIGNDSFPLHAAQAMGCPTVGLFGTTLPRFIFTQGSKAAAASASPNIPCAGERHRVMGKTFVDCNAACINSITVEDAWAAIERLEVL